MTSGSNYSPKQQKFADLILILMQKRYWFPEEADETIPLEIILNRCAEAWGVTEDDLKGKINHSNHKERIMKYSFLLGCELFNTNASKQDELDLVGYTRKQGGGRYVPTTRCNIETFTRYTLHILNFLQTLVTIAPNRLELLKRNIEDMQQRYSPKPTPWPTTGDYIDELRNQNEFLRTQLEKFMTQKQSPEESVDILIRGDKHSFLLSRNFVPGHYFTHNCLHTHLSGFIRERRN
jgi:hypothetical protein